MRLKNIIIAIALITVGTASVVPAGFAMAQSVGVVPVNDFSNGMKIDAVQRTLGTAPAPLTTVIDVIGEIRSGLSQACVSVISQISSTGVSSFINSLNSTNIGLIGGSETEAILVKGQATSYTAALECVDEYIDALRDAEAKTVIQASELQREQATYSGVRDALSQRVDAMNQRASASWKDVLKAFMVRTVLSISKNLTTEVVNNLVQKYKISDYMAYGDALTTQVYSMKYINENFAGDARQQMMIRSLLQSEKFPEQMKTVQAMANSKAQEYLGDACNVKTPGISADDQNYFLKCLAAYGSEKASPQFHVLNAVNQAQAAKASANASTTAELAQSSGFAPPRNCSGSLTAQKQIDDQYNKAYQEKDVAVAIAARLKTALNANPPKTTKTEYDKAQAAADQAIANVEALKKNVTLNSDGETSDSPIIDICEAIDSPANFVAKSINDYLAKNFNESAALKTENLPFYATYLSDVASNFLTNILTGGKSTSQVLKEAGVGALNGALISVAQTAGGSGTGTGTTPNPTGDVQIYATVNGTRTTTLAPNSSYQLVIDFRELVATSSNGKDPVFNPFRLLISGATSGSDFNLTLSAEDLTAGRIILDGTTPANNQSFNIRVQAFARAPQGTTGDVPLNTSGGWTQRFTVGTVSGAVSVLPRGPQMQLR